MKTTRIHFLLCSVLMVFMISVPAVSQADRIKDLTTLAGARSNQLVGYGLVVGLAGTGDRDKISFTAQSLKATLERLGVDVDGPISNYDLFIGINSFQLNSLASRLDRECNFRDCCNTGHFIFHLCVQIVPKSRRC